MICASAHAAPFVEMSCDALPVPPRRCFFWRPSPRPTPMSLNCGRRWNSGRGPMTSAPPPSSPPPAPRWMFWKRARNGRPLLMRAGASMRMLRRSPPPRPPINQAPIRPAITATPIPAAASSSRAPWRGCVIASRWDSSSATTDSIPADPPVSASPRLRQNRAKALSRAPSFSGASAAAPRNGKRRLRRSLLHFLDL